jgi:hypothetical protein
MLPRFLIATFCLLVSACAVSNPKIAGSDSRLKVKEWTGDQFQDMEDSSEPASLKIPLVDFGKMPAAFGKPSWRTSPRGPYVLGYFENAKTPAGESYSLSVFGCVKPAPVLVDACSVLEPGQPGKLDESRRTWSTVQVPGLNRSLRYQFTTMSFGDTDDTWETEPFTVTTPDGKTGSYQAIIECENAEVAARMFSKLQVR